MRREKLNAYERSILLMTLKQLLKKKYKIDLRDIDSVSRERYPEVYKIKDSFLSEPIFSKKFVDFYLDTIAEEPNLKNTSTKDIFYYFYEGTNIKDDMYIAGDEFFEYQKYTVGDLLFDENKIIKKELEKLRIQSGINFTVQTENLKLFFYFMWKIQNRKIIDRECFCSRNSYVDHRLQILNESFKKAILYFENYPKMKEFIMIFSLDFCMGLEVEDSHYMHLFEENVLKIFLCDLNFENFVSKDNAELFKESSIAIDPTYRKLLMV